MTPPRALRRLELHPSDPHPAYVVWELTLACDQPCTHCGSRAGDARPRELSTEEALAVVAQLAAMRAQEVVLIGGEAYLHDGFLRIVSALRDRGIRPTMTTGGRGVTAEMARAMAGAGLYSASVSVDGLEATHDLIRAARGSFASATAALDHLRAAGITVAANTNVNRLNAAELEPLYEHLRAHGVRSWQVQLTAPLGRAADRADLILQPWDLLDVVPRVAALKKRAFGDGILLMPGNNLGYFGPEEALLRSTTEDGRDHFQGCAAGRFVLGIESDGAVKGCPSLQTKRYVGGSLLERSLEEIWNDAPELAFARARTRDDLWGFCSTCPFAEPCMGGAPSRRTRCSGGRATTPIAATARGRSPRAGFGSGSSPRSVRPANRSTTGVSISSSRRSTRPTRGRALRASSCASAARAIRVVRVSPEPRAAHEGDHLVGAATTPRLCIRSA